MFTFRREYQGRYVAASLMNEGGGLRVKVVGALDEDGSAVVSVGDMKLFQKKISMDLPERVRKLFDLFKVDIKRCTWNFRSQG